MDYLLRLWKSHRHGSKTTTERAKFTKRVTCHFARFADIYSDDNRSHPDRRRGVVQQSSRVPEKRDARVVRPVGNSMVERGPCSTKIQSREEIVEIKPTTKSNSRAAARSSRSTEALVAIDVNSGNSEQTRRRRGNAFRLERFRAKEIARANFRLP